MAAIVLGALAGCAIPPPEKLPLRVEDARRALDRWNPQYCKVNEFHGFYDPGADTRVAYVSVVSPVHPDMKPTLYEARFQLLTKPNGRQQWFLTSLLNHAAGLTRRQGWDNLLIPVESESP